MGTRAGGHPSTPTRHEPAPASPPRSLGVDGVRVGHWTDSHSQTGCTVVEFPEGTTASYEARGGAPASREVELLRPDKAVTAIDAVLLTGGSAFGLTAADGVMRYYAERGRGVPTPAGPVPIVPTLALYDLAAGDGTVRPTAEHGYAAALATTGEQILTGRVGAGTGAHVGHWRGPEGRRPAGLATHVAVLGDLVVTALCVVNAFGDIEDGLDGGEPPDTLIHPFDFTAGAPTGRQHTTIGVVCTNARLDKVACQVVAQGAHDGLARAVSPPHTRYDGDAFVAAATSVVDADLDLVRYLAVIAVSRAIRSVRGENSRP